MFSRFQLASALVFTLLPVIASADTILNPGDILRVEFSVSKPSCPGGPCDVLMFMPSAETANFPVAAGWTLSNGVNILGTHSGAHAGNFRAEDSLFTDTNAATVDFTSILDGSISGIAEFSLLDGQLIWSGEPGAFITLGRAEGPGFVNANSESGLNLICISIITNPAHNSDSGLKAITSEIMVANLLTETPPTSGVPEPSSIVMALSGLLLVGLGSVRRKPEARKMVDASPQK